MTMLIICLLSIIIFMLGIYLFSVEKDSEKLVEIIEELRNKCQTNAGYVTQLIHELQEKNNQLTELNAKLILSECKPKKKCCKIKDKGE